METFYALLAICAGNWPVPGEFPTQRPVTRSFDVFFALRPNKCLSKQSWGWWFETPSHPLWIHRNDISDPFWRSFLSTQDRQYRKGSYKFHYEVIIGAEQATSHFPEVVKRKTITYLVIDPDQFCNIMEKRFFQKCN